MVTLANPFAIDLEIQSIGMSTEGVPFTPNMISTTIPANTSVTLQLSGVPTRAGQLVVRGCKIKVMFCTEQEFCVFLPPKEEEIKKREKEEQDNSRAKAR
jgi:hypothetical protein